MIDEEATRALRALRARRIARDRFRVSARNEDCRSIERWDSFYERLYLADWLDMCEKVSPAFNDPSRRGEDEQRAPPSIICPATPGTFDNNTHWPWQNYMNRTQLRDRRRRREAAELRAKTRT